jgi:hypothetical protein
MKVTIKFEYNKYEEGMKNTEGEQIALIMMKGQEAFWALFNYRDQLRDKVKEADEDQDAELYLILNHQLKILEDLIEEKIPDFNQLMGEE